MRITEVRTELLRMPLPRPMQSGSSSGKKGGPVSHINMPVVFITTEDGTRGIGYAWSLLGGATATRCVLQDDFAPLLIDEDALDHERLWHKLYKRLQSVGRHGLVTQAQAAVDLALWDIKGKIAGLPVYKLLGGRRESAPVYGSDGGWLYMSVSEMVAAFEGYLEQGMMGVKMKIGHEDPKVDIKRVREVRKALGDDVWIAVDANQKWDFPTAMWVGRELEQLGCCMVRGAVIVRGYSRPRQARGRIGYSHRHGRNIGVALRIRRLSAGRCGRYSATGYYSGRRHYRNGQSGHHG